MLVIGFSAFANAHIITTKNAAVEEAVGTLTGTVTDKADGKPVIGATVSIPDLHAGAITDVNGKYVLNHVPRGVYLVQVSYLGYATFNQKVDLSKTSVFDVKLQASSLEKS